jgi:hypothetical protein
VAGFEDTPVSSADAFAALLFLAAINETMQAYGTLNSSPWTAESFGADDRRARAMKEYVSHAVTFSMGTSLIAAWVARGKKATWAIILGAAGTNFYLVWLYLRASKRGRAAGAKTWASESATPNAPGVGPYTWR